MKYPDDFSTFKGRRLSTEEIDSLVQEAWENYGHDQASEFDDFLGGVRTGDTKIEIEEHGHIIIWKQVADIWIVIGGERR